MIKIIYVFGIFLSSLTFSYATEELVSSSETVESAFAAEWIGLIILSLIGFMFIYKSARQITKIKKLQTELDQYHTTVSSELDTIGGKNA